MSASLPGFDIDAQNEITQLKRQVEELRKALAERSTPPPQFDVANDPPSPFLNNLELVTDLTRFAEGLLEEKHVRKKYRFTEDDWTKLGADEKFVEAVELERIRRIRDGSFKREKAQQLIVKGPDVLDSIMMDTKASPKHKVDAIKTLDALADPGAQAAHNDSDRIVIKIDLGSDVRASGGTPTQADILTFEASVRPSPDPNNAEIVRDHHTPMIEQEAIPLKRGPGRPPGSKNKPKLDQQEPLPGFITDADHL